MSAEDRIERARTAYDRMVYNGDAGGLADAEQGLDVVEADAAQNRRADATLDEAYAIARSHGADAIVRQIEQARTAI